MLNDSSASVNPRGLLGKKDILNDVEFEVTWCEVCLESNVLQSELIGTFE